MARSRLNRARALHGCRLVRLSAEAIRGAAIALLASILAVSGASAWCIGAPAIDGQPVVDPVLDNDGDGLNNLQEALIGTDPDDPDTDGDGVPDSEEIVEGVRLLDRPSLFSIERFADPRVPEARQVLVLEGTNLFRRGRRFNTGRRNGFAEVRVEETDARRLVVQRRPSNNQNRIALELSDPQAARFLGDLPAHLSVQTANRRRTNALALMDMPIRCDEPHLMGAALVRLHAELGHTRKAHDYIGIGGCGLVRSTPGQGLESTVVLTQHALPVAGAHRITIRGPNGDAALIGSRILTPVRPLIKPDALNPLPEGTDEIEIGDRLTVVLDPDAALDGAVVVVVDGIVADLTIPESNLDEDHDGDGLSSASELRNGTDPLVFDTDRDGLSDGVERRLGLDPNDPDSDDDGIPDGAELQAAAVMAALMPGRGDPLAAFAAALHAGLMWAAPGSLLK
jgi:Bacterial TSP3 repeat